MINKIFNKKNILKISFLIFLTIFFLLFFLFKINKYFTYENVENVKKMILNLSFFGPVVIIFLYIIFNLAMMPTFFFIFICGYLYKPLYGFLLGWSGMIIGLAVSFLNSRYCFRDSFNKKFGATKMFKILDDVTKKYHGWAVIFFRLFFIVPYNFQNVAYGLTSIKFYTYTLGSAVGILPTTILYIWLGYMLSHNQINQDYIKNILLYSKAISYNFFASS